MNARKPLRLPILLLCADIAFTPAQLRAQAQPYPPPQGGSDQQHRPEPGPEPGPSRAEHSPFRVA